MSDAEAGTETTDNPTSEKEARAGLRKGSPDSVGFSSDGPATDWRTYFPYDQPRNAQVDGIENIIETASDRGYTTLEGACGTGKTLVALCGGIQLVRDPDSPYERLFCVTPVKQQLQAFEDDLRAINRALDNRENDSDNGSDNDSGIEPVSGLTLVGKADVCSYTNTGRIDDRAIYGKCEDLREPVRRAARYADDGQRAVRELANDARLDSYNTSTNTTAQQPVATNDWTSPYTQQFPETDQSDTPYCPFYAKYRAETFDEGDGGYTPEGMLTPDDLVAQASNAGLCPHAVMSDSLQNAEVVIGNYYHLFDPTTLAAMTGELIDDQTLVVCDEAHMLIPRVRDLLSDTLTHSTLSNAISEIENRVLEQDRPGVDRILRQTLAEEGVREDDLRSFVEFLHEAKFFLEEQAVDALDDEDSNWERTNMAELPDEIQHPLRNPTTPQPDRFSEWAADNGYTNILRDASHIGTAVATALREASNRHSTFECSKTFSDTVGGVFGRWVECGHEQYFRSVELQQRASRDPSADLAWNKEYTAQFQMHNCLPATEIAGRLGQFAGGLLMSATLEPLDVYQRSVGLDQLEAKGRPVQELTYGLPFPDENRASFAVDLEKFTYKNRGGTDGRWRDPSQDALREHYAEVVQSVAQTTPGNVLVAMPSYAEGEWIADVLRQSGGVRKEVLVDESSANEVTDELKDEFFAGGDKLLVTSLRGTLTEGVDYDGDRLAACVVCGVPITNINGPVPKAIKTAYEREFGQHNGFDYAFTVPAVRKARQALGRVIRGHDEVGVRVAADRRYASRHQWDDVREYLPQYEREDYTPVERTDLDGQLEAFWNES